MVRHRLSPAVLAALVALSASLAGCGIKGPLVPPPQPGASVPPGTAAPAAQDKPPEPKL